MPVGIHPSSFSIKSKDFPYALADTIASAVFWEPPFETPNEGSVVELGPGRGDLTIELSNCFHQNPLYVLDKDFQRFGKFDFSSEDMKQAITKSLDRAQKIELDLRERKALPLEDQSTRLIVMSLVASYLSQDELGHVISELRRISKSGAAVVIVNYHHDYYNLYFESERGQKLGRRETFSYQSEEGTLYAHGMYVIPELLRSNGFSLSEIIDIRTTLDSPYLSQREDYREKRIKVIRFFIARG